MTKKGAIPLFQKLDKLYTEIEIKRHTLHERLKVYQDFTHPCIIVISQELDDLLNEVNMLKKEEYLN